MRYTFFLSLLFSFIVSDAQTFLLDNRLTAHDKEAGEQYGSEVDIHDDIMIVGAPLDGVSTTMLGGAAYIYQNTAGVWTLLAKIRSNDSLTNKDFGMAVAISDSFAVVGDPNEADRGAAYVFKRSGSTWTQVAKLEATVPSTFDEFGDDVEIDGDWIFVAAPQEEEDTGEVNNVSLAGSVFTFLFDGTDWNFDSKIVPADRVLGSSQRFGKSIAADQGKLIIGAPWRADSVKTNVGAVYFYEVIFGVWSQNTMLRPADGESSDFFGTDVDIKGATAIVGSINHDYDLSGSDFKGESGAAYYMNYTGTWSTGGKLIWSGRDNGDYFGSSVAVTPNEEYIIVGMYEDNTTFEFDGDTYNKSECGAAVVYAKDTSGYIELQRITPSIKATQDHFGNTMAATNTTLVVGAYLDDIENFPNSGLCNLDSIADNGAVDIFKLGAGTSVNNLKTQNHFEIYPNPVSDILNIKSKLPIETIQIYNLEGQLLLMNEDYTSNSIDLAEFGSGFYFVRINGEKAQPFIKQ